MLIWRCLCFACFKSHISMAWHKTAVTPVLMHWSYRSLALSHLYVHNRSMCSSQGNSLTKLRGCPELVPTPVCNHNRHHHSSKPYIVYHKCSNTNVLVRLVGLHFFLCLIQTSGWNISPSKWHIDTESNSYTVANVVSVPKRVSTTAPVWGVLSRWSCVY